MVLKRRSHKLERRWRPGELGRHVLAALRKGSRVLAGIVFPPVCLACRRATAEHDALCAPCWSAVRFIERPFCERLGTPFSHDLGDGLLSPEAIANPPVYARARTVARFDDGAVRKMVHGLKYGDRTELPGAMGAWMVRAGDDLLGEADLLLPIPLHHRRLAARRFNQSMLLARVISRSTGIPLETRALVRTRRTPPQVGLTRTQRALNVQGAFRIDPVHAGVVTDRAIVLVDDVLTSGATVNAAARCLLRAGAARVDVLTFARVVTEA